MSRFTAENEAIAREIISRYPVKKSATIPLCHLAQEQDGHLTDDAMEHIADLLGLTAAEVLGTASFYEMFKREQVGTYVINVCTSISCFLNGGDELLEHAERTLGIAPGATTDDGMFTIEGYECIAACTEAPCMQVNYRYFHKVSNDQFDAVVADLRAGRQPRAEGRPVEIPSHGVLARIRQSIPTEKGAGPADPVGGSQPVWLTDQPAMGGGS
ncbi:MAG: NADH-quinone oxidoreductase subunit [Acidimicrobiaceae bacterium]